MSNILTKLDFLGPKFKLRYNSKQRNGTVFGSVVSLIVVSIIILAFVFFGAEIVAKENPLSKTAKIYTDESKIYLKHYPLVFTLLNGTEIANYLALEEFDFLGLNTIIEGDNSSIGTVNRLLIQPCTAQMLAESDYTSTQNYTSSFCVNPFYILNSKNEPVKQDVFIEAKPDGVGKSVIRIMLTRKRKNLTKPLPGNIVINLSYRNTYVNVSDYQNPLIKTLKTIGLILDTTLSVTQQIELSRNVFSSDEGYVFKAVQSTAFYSAIKPSTEYSFVSDEYPVLATFNFTTALLVDKHEREYKKLQTLFAEIAGTVKIVVLIGSYLVEQVADYSFYTQYCRQIESRNSITTIAFAPNESRVSLQMKRNAVRQTEMPFLAYFFNPIRKQNIKFFSPSLVEDEFDILKLRKQFVAISETCKRLSDNTDTLFNLRREH